MSPDQTDRVCRELVKFLESVDGAQLGLLAEGWQVAIELHQLQRRDVNTSGFHIVRPDWADQPRGRSGKPTLVVLMTLMDIESEFHDEYVLPLELARSCGEQVSRNMVLASARLALAGSRRRIAEANAAWFGSQPALHARHRTRDGHDSPHKRRGVET